MAGASVSATVRVHSSASGFGLTGANAVLPITSANLQAEHLRTSSVHATPVLTL
jgi:hypothetical protein